MWIFGGSLCLMLWSLGCFLPLWDFERFVLRGQVRWRWCSLSRSRSSVSVSRIAVRRRRGGKARLVTDLAADDSEAVEEGDSMIVFVDVVGGFAAEIGDRIVGE